jgi:hypothetical protein
MLLIDFDNYDTGAAVTACTCCSTTRTTATAT